MLPLHRRAGLRGCSLGHVGCSTSDYSIIKIRASTRRDRHVKGGGDWIQLLSSLKGGRK
jgi:hypothetical protein